MEEVTKAIIEMMDYILDLHKKGAEQTLKIQLLDERVKTLETYVKTPTNCCEGGPQWGHSWDCSKTQG